MNFSDDQALSKVDIAKAQVDGAIRAFFLGSDPVIVATLVSPASQILRDLNKPNPKAVSSAITYVFEEVQRGLSGKLWKEFNMSAGILKHANDATQVLTLDKIATWNEQSGSILFCIAEYNAHVGNVSRYMYAFIMYWRRREARRSHSHFIDTLDRHMTVRRVDARLAFFGTLLKMLLRAKAYLDGQAERRAAAKTDAGSGRDQR
jgi:hypothetical protein